MAWDGKNLPGTKGDPGLSLGREDSLEKEWQPTAECLRTRIEWEAGGHSPEEKNQND